MSSDRLPPGSEPALHPLLIAAVRDGSASPETGALLVATDWAASPLGPMTEWPQALRIAVSICLNSCFPMFVWWGPSLVNIYNDAYIPVMGKRHPDGFGRSAPELWREVWDVIGPQQEAVMQRGEATWNERVLLVLERNGFTEETWFTWSYSPIYREDGTIGGLFCACTEETGRVRAERERDRLMAEARDAARTLQTWFDNAPGFVALVRGPEFVFELVNKAYYQLVGHREILGKKAFDALPELREQGFKELLLQVYESHQPFIGRELPVKLQQEPGAPLVERYIDLVYQPVFAADGSVSGIFAQGHDVTDQVLATRALQEADRRKDEFLATLAHELRNPLAPIRQAAALARMTALGPERRAWALDLIERQVKQMTLLIDDLLDLSRISRGKLELRRERVDLRSVIAAALETSQPLVDARGHRLDLRLPDRPVPLEADRLRLAQVTSNLLSNAAKYTDPGGTVTLEVREEGDEALIRVADTGIGLSPQDLERIFLMFSQVDAALDRSEGGLGIGLALSRGLVEMHGGRIEATSAGRGQGAEFVVRLPRGPADAGGQPGRVATAGAAVPARCRRVLVADDNADAVESLGMLLEAEGHEVYRAGDGEEAVATAQRVRPDVVILDIGMPGLNGYEVARRLRDGPDPQPLLIALTGWGQSQDQARAAESGFDHHCTKPVEIDRLLELVQQSREGGAS